MDNDEVSIIKNKEFILKRINKTNYKGTSNSQTTSIGIGLIPFLEHNDSNRALMGSNMQKQAIPINSRERPLIQTGIEKDIAKNSELSVETTKSGFLRYRNDKMILYQEKTKNYYNLKLSKLKKVKFINNNKKAILKIDSYTRRYFDITRKQKSNQNTELTQLKTNKNQRWIRKGTIINESLGIKKGGLAIGKNLLIGYMIWEGYNFEDAIVVSERLLKENLFTSNHIKRYKVFLIKDETGKVRKNLFA